MIITRTPLRVSFAGGGSDLPAFYQGEPGCVVSATIDRYVYITVNRKYDGQVRVSYSQTENVARSSEVAHPLVRACLELANLRSGIEVVSVADIPSGTGLGSSSAFTVGLLAALYAYQGEFASAERLARDACAVEMDLCHQPIGKQDQYAAAYGGLRCYAFLSDGGVTIEALAIPEDAKRYFASHLLLLDSGKRHDAGAILRQHETALLDSGKRANVRRMANLAHAFRDAMLTGNRLSELGEIMDTAWQLKRGIVAGTTDDAIDAAYDRAKRAGAIGGKLCGAGGGGMLLLFGPRDRLPNIARAVGWRAVPFGLSSAGAQVIYAD